MDLTNVLLGCGIALVMGYTGLLFSWSELRRHMGPARVRALVGLAVANYLVIPAMTYAFFRMSAEPTALRLTLLTMAILPCAPLVPAMVSFAGEKPEWSLLVFLAFSVLNLGLVIVLTAVLSQTQHRGVVQADVLHGLGGYVAAVYGPMLLGIFVRWVAPNRAAGLNRIVRPLSGATLLVALISFGIVHREDFAATSLSDLGVMFLFVIACILVVAPLGERAGGPRMTRLIASGFRNVALAIAFSTLVLQRNDVSAGIVIFAGVAGIVCAGVIGLSAIVRHLGTGQFGVRPR